MKYEPIKHSIDGIISKSPSLKRLFFKLLDLYLLRTWHVHKALLNLRGRFAGQKINVLDGGAGFGQYSFWILRKFKNSEVLGVDISQSHVDKAQKFFNQSGFEKRAHFEQADLTNWSQNEAFDLAITVDVMEHILEDRMVFKNFYTSLKPGGILLVSTPSDKGGSDVHDHDHDHDHANDGSESFIDEHVRDGYSIEDITEKLKSAGFSKVHARYTYGKPGQKSWRLLMKIPITLLNASKIFFIILPVYWIFTIPYCLILNKMDVSRTHEEGTGLIVEAYK